MCTSQCRTCPRPRSTSSPLAELQSPCSCLVCRLWSRHSIRLLASTQMSCFDLVPVLHTLPDFIASRETSSLWYIEVSSPRRLQRDKRGSPILATPSDIVTTFMGFLSGHPNRHMSRSTTDASSACKILAISGVLQVFDLLGHMCMKYLLLWTVCVGGGGESERCKMWTHEEPS